MNRLPRPRFALPLAALGTGALIAAAAPGFAAVSTSSVPQPAPAPRPAVSLAVAPTADLAAGGRSAVVHLTATCPTGYRGAVVVEVAGRGTTHGTAHAFGIAPVTCTGASQTVDVPAQVLRHDRRALKAGTVKVGARLAVRPAVPQHGHSKGPVRTANAVRSATLG